MADVSIDASVSTSTARGMRSVVFTEGSVTFDSYSQTNQSNATLFRTTGAVTEGGQAFAGQNINLKSVVFYLNKVGSPTGNMRANLYAATGTLGTTATAIGSALATSADIDITTLTTSFALVTFTFSSPYTLSSGTNYVIVLQPDWTDNSNYVQMGNDTTTPSHAGNGVLHQATWNASSATDYCFYLIDDSVGQIGYWFYIDSGGTFVYSKTTDGGASWGAAVTISAATTIIAYDVWFDQWTPGDSGTLIHTWYFDSTNDIVYWRSLNTATDTLGTQRSAFAGASAVAGRGAFCSGTKTRSGYLYVAFDIDAGAERGLVRSVDSGTTWSANLAATFVGATIDQCLLFPATGTGDNNDCWAIYQTAASDTLTMKMWDSSAAAAVVSSSFQTMAENVTDLTGQMGFAGAVRDSDGALIVVSCSERDTATADMEVWSVTGVTASSLTGITALTDITTNIDDNYYPSVFIDQNTDAIYVAYNGKRDGLEVLGTTTKTYYTKSTDGGTTWTAGDTAYQEGATTANFQTWAPLSGPRFYVGWRVGTTLVGNAVNSVDVTAAPPAAARRVFIMAA